MKATLIILLLFTFAISLDAQYYFDQWYFKKYQITSIKNCTPEEFDLLWTDVNKLGKTGKKITIVGTSAMALPFLIAIANPYALYLALFTVPVGVVMDIIGISCMLTANSRKSILMNTPHYTHQNIGEWYFIKCGVTDINSCTPEEFECLWSKAKKLKNTGIGLSAAGTTLAIAAGAVWLSDPYSWTGADWPHSYYWWLFGVIGVPTGILLDLIGIPCIVKGHNRIKQLKITPYYKSQSSVALNLNPTLLRNHINNTYSVGLSARISF